MTSLTILGAVLITGLLAYWLLITTEGVYLGQRIVILLYDLTARRYDKLKEYNSEDEAANLGEPLAGKLAKIPYPLILDVATGTGRLPETLLGQPSFNGIIIASDRSFWMLAEAKRKWSNSNKPRVNWLICSAGALPFASAGFDAVCCLEALEFFPDAGAAVAELSRVLKAGGLLLTSQRIGLEARLMPGHCWNRLQMLAVLRANGLINITIKVWQAIYNLVWAVKPAPDKSACRLPVLPEPVRDTQRGHAAESPAESIKHISEES